MHNIIYLVFNEKEDRRNIMADIQERARDDGDGYSSRITWHDKVEPLESYEEAKEFIESHDNGWYDDHAVRFRDYSTATKTKRMEEYESKISELTKSMREYKEKHSVHMLQAKHIGCPKCNSKLNKEYLRGETCPLCNEDLRSKTTLEKLEWYREKIRDYNSRIYEEQRKQKKNCKIKWLVKVEYHS